MKKIVITFISISFAFLANLDGVISLFERAFTTTNLDNNKLQNMQHSDNVRIFIQIVSILITFFVSYYFLNEIRKMKKNVLKYNDNHKEEIESTVIIFDTIKNRELDFLWNYIESLRNNQPPPIAPDSWLTDLEKMQYDSLISKSTNLSEAIKKKFKKGNLVV